jgi:hypothetical protein
MLLHLAQDAVEVDGMAGIHDDQRSDAERPEGRQPDEVGDQMIAAPVSIQMPGVALASQEALGRDFCRTDTMDLDDPSGQSRDPAGRCT